MQRDVPRDDATRLIAMALVTVQRSPSVSSSPQSSVSFVHFSFLVTRRRVSLEWLTRVTITVSFRGNAIVTSPPPRSFDSRSAAARASSPRASSCNRPPTGRSTLFGGAPTAEREWDNGNRGWNRKFPRTRVAVSRVSLSRRARRAILSTGAESAPKQRDSERKQT